MPRVFRHIQIPRVPFLRLDYEYLHGEYLAKGSALSLTFSVASGMHLAGSAAELRNAIASAVKELDNGRWYQVRQKLGGKLNIHVEEAVLRLL